MNMPFLHPQQAALAQQASLIGMPAKQLATLANAGIDGKLVSGKALEGMVAVNILYWRVVGLVPQKASRVKFTIDTTNKKMRLDTQKLLNTWAKQFQIAQQRSDTLGFGSYIIINTFDERGRATSATAIRDNSVSKIQLIAISDQLERKGDYYYYPPDLEGKRKKIHHTRVLQFLPRNGGSAAQRFHFGMQLYRGALSSALATTINKNTVVVTKRGLDDDVAAAESPEEFIRETLRPIIAVRNEEGILLLDAKFEATLLEHNLTQVAEVVKTARAFAIACSGLTERQLLNTVDSDVRITGEDPDAISLAEQVDTLVEQDWMPMYDHLLGILRTDYSEVGIYPKTSYALSATARSAVMLEFARACAVMLDYQVLIPEDVRPAWDGEFTAELALVSNYKPPRKLKKHEKNNAGRNQDSSRVSPDNRITQDGKTGDSTSQGSEGGRASDEALSAMIKTIGLGKSQPRLGTLHKVSDRALNDGENPIERVSLFLHRWKGDVVICADEDLIPAHKK